MRTTLFFGVLLGMTASNFIYQAFKSAPDWAIATERSWFQMMALIALGLSWAVASINHKR